MIKIVKTDGKTEKDFLMSLKARSSEVDKKVTAIVGDIIDNVKQRGDAAVLEYTEKFDGKLPLYYEVPSDVVDEAVSECDDALIQSLRKAADNIADFHKRQVQQSFMDAREDGSVLGQTVRGLQRVGIYVPGGTAAYPSSVLMNAIPAKIAGVREIVMVTPPLKDGTPNKNILAAAKIAGVDKIFMCGGAQAVAALAYGTEKMPKVDKIVGPGNIFVATAKRMLYGVVDIDMIAGPSEILIIADSTANPKFLAADLMSQAEHDMLASAILITTDEKLAQQTNEQLKIQSATLSRCDIIKKSLEDYGAIIVCNNMDEAVALANELAPEHLEVCADNPMQYLSSLKNAGSIFLGNNSPEPLGDYFAGPNHVLPTGGTSRFFSPLSVDSFIKKTQFIYYSEKALQRDADDIIRLANTEGLTAHANSIIVRTED